MYIIYTEGFLVNMIWTQCVRLALIKIRITYSESDLSASLMVETRLFGLPPSFLIALSPHMTPYLPLLNIFIFVYFAKAKIIMIKL